MKRFKLFAVLLFLTGRAWALQPIGTLEQVNCFQVLGWACDTSTPFSHATIRIYDGPISQGRLLIQDATGTFGGTPQCGGNGNHGFQLQMPASVLDGQTHQIYAYATDPAGQFPNTPLTNSPLPLTCAPAPVITSPLSAAAVVGQAFTYQMAATQNPTMFTTSNLPAGLQINETTGRITGTPTVAGVYTIDMWAANANGVGSAVLTLTITSPPALPQINSPTSVSGTVGTNVSVQMVATNNPTSFGGSSLPPGVTVNAGNGLISGIPTLAGTFQSVLSATNAGGQSTRQVTFTIAAAPAPPVPVITSANSALATIGQAFMFQLTATNNPTSFTAQGLGAGLSMNTAGRITGTPNAVGTLDVYITGTNASGTGPEFIMLIHISSPPTTPCDVDRNLSTNVLDVQLMVNQALMISDCISDINRDGSCTVSDVQRVVNAALTGVCNTN